jgi:L-alanine-DL-glutamate epimerase-like enolase superfamily enzyme
MDSMPTIRRIELTSFTITVPNVTTDRTGSGVHFHPGPGGEQLRFAIRMETDAGITGEYVPPRGRVNMVMRAVEFLAPRLLGANALERERHYRALRLATKHVGEIGIGALDIALWDIAGKLHGQPIFRLLGGHRERLPAYASTLHGDNIDGGLNSPQAYADFAQACLEMGYPAYKTHGWSAGNVKQESTMLKAVADAVGDRMTLMYDAACHLATFHDAVQVGKVCDEHNYFWYEDPFADGGVSTFAHQRLKQFVKTPLLVTEHIHTPEVSTDMLVNGATDFGRADPDYDCGITGSMKIATAADALGMDTEVHACGPAMRHVMAALAKSNYYEVNLLHPVIGNAWDLPVYTCGYSDSIDCIDANGTVGVPTGPGLGVSYDWDYIRAHAVDTVVLE